MDRTADAVVIGGGIMGASTAHFLARKGFGHVVLLEKQTLGAVSTGHSAAVVRTFYSNALTIRLAVRALEMFENDRDELGGDCDFCNIGYLALLEEESLASGRQVAELETSLGAEIKEIFPEEIKEIVPEMDVDRLAAGLLEPRSGYADPVKTARTLVESAEAWGLSAHEGVEVTGIRVERDRVIGVETAQGNIDAGVVVNAAGPWGRQVGLSIGLNDSLRWSRESDLVLRLPSGMGKTFPVLSDPNLRIYIRPEGDGEALMGLGAPKEVEPMDIDNYDPELDAKTRRRIEEGCFKRIPSLADGEYVRSWASIYAISDDWHPIVGPEPGLEGYFACFAGSGHGFKLGPPIGEALSGVIVGDTPKIDICAFRPNRFVEGEVFTSAWGGGNRA